MAKYKVEELPKGFVKVYGVKTYEHGEVDLTLRPLNWDDKVFLRNVDPNDKQQLCQSYARMISEWSLEEPVLATTLLQDDFVHLCTVVDALIRTFFLETIEFVTS